jgi:low affinity Fe/Cu permease
MKQIFHNLAHKTSNLFGSPWAFLVALLIVIIWGITGPIFKFSDTWQLVINTGTTIVTFLTVFLIQNTQNRDSQALHLKLDEIIRSIEGARNNLIDLEDCTDEEIKQFQNEFMELRNKYLKGK